MRKVYKIILFLIVLVALNCNLVFAAQNNINPAVTKAKLVKEYSDTYRYNWMDKVWIGLYPQKSSDPTNVRPLEWLVLDKQGDKALLISRYVIDKLPYNLTNDFCTWETSYIRQWLNNDFYNFAFDQDDKSYIIPTTNITNDKWANTTVTTIDNIFLLSDDEVIKYFNLSKDGFDNFYDNNRMESSYTEYAKAKGKIAANDYCYYFLRGTRHKLDESLYCADFVEVDETNDGLKTYIEMYPLEGGGEVNFPHGIRPAMWVKFDPNAKGEIPDIVGIADDLGITNDVIKEGVKVATDYIPMPKPVGVIKDKVIDAVGDKVIDAVRGK